ncbi:MAG: WYL domain-containing protein [bacterium]|nr:WYL domain-containing protein [bacterium]
MSKLGNTLAMLKILETGRKYTVNELASMIEVSPRMIKTYKAELEKAGIYIDTISGIYGGYVYNHKNNYDVSFSINDVSCLEKIIPMLESKNRNVVEQLLEKIKTIVIYSDSNLIEKQDSQELKNKYNIVSKAIKNNTDIEIEYKKKDKIVTPHNISFYKDFIYLTGYSKTDKDLRTYNLSEIVIK